MTSAPQSQPQPPRARASDGTSTPPANSAGGPATSATSATLSATAGATTTTTAGSSPASTRRSTILEGNAAERLAFVVELMRGTSVHTDPQALVNDYGERIAKIFQTRGFVSLSRRNMPEGVFRITRATAWEDQEIDPWRTPERLPVHSSGIFRELIYGDVPRIIRDPVLAPDDPARVYIGDHRCVVAIPHYDAGVATNMVIMLFPEPDAMDEENFAEWVWLSNLFGRATGSLVMARTLRETNAALDREMRAVAEMQLALLPRSLPKLAGVDFAAFYQTSKNAGGDYYDFFNLPGGKLGILIADVSGHGTPAAVLMAILHAIAHQSPRPDDNPAQMLAHLNRELCARYTGDNGIAAMFATAFYAIFDPATRRLDYASAGHPAPRLRIGFTLPSSNTTCTNAPSVGAAHASSAEDQGAVLALSSAHGLPLGVMDDAIYSGASVTLDPGDCVVFYTDGITEAWGPGTGAPGQARKREMFDEPRLDAVVARAHESAAALKNALLEAVNTFAAGVPPADDQTVLVMGLREG
jgi:sigma-B regulation protein RsbU (phosphoserine phosphatase)